jgi:hypothetical protein
MADQLPPVDLSTFKPLGSASTPAAIPSAQTQGLPPVDMSSFKPLGGSSPDTQKATPLPAGQTDVGAALGTEPIKTSDIPLPSKDTKGGYRDLKALPMDWSGLTGIGKDLLSAAKGVVTGALQGPKDETEKYIQILGGPAALPIYHALVGAGHTAKEATEIIGAVKDINQSADPLGAYAKALQKTSSQGAAQATLALATEGVLKAAPKVADLAGAAYKNTKGLISHSTLQEPLQTGVRNIVGDAVADTKAQIAANPAKPATPLTDAHPVKLVRSPDGDVLDLDGRHRVMQAIERGDPRIGVQTTMRDGSVSTLQVDPKLVAKEFGVTKESLAATDEVQGATREGGGQPRKPVLVPKEGASKNLIEGAEKIPEATPTKSIRKIAEQAGDTVKGAAISDYQALDEATNGRFQRFREKLEAGRKQLRDAITTEDEAPILKKMKETEDEMADAFAEAKAKGVDPKLIDRADASFRKSQALHDLDNAIKKSTTGAHPDSSTSELLKESPETLNPKKLHLRINALYDSGRLQDALGEEGANKLFDHTLEHSGAYDKIMRNRKLGMIGGGAALGAAGAGGYVAHKLAGTALGQ